ncbi:TIGR00341 family protein [bacterium]|nr:TIGR00341 family protein [bacterium]
MILKTLFKIDKTARNNFISKVIDSSFSSPDFYFLMFLASVIVTFGLALNNITLVIGGMLVAPLLSPIMAIALGLVTNEKKLFFRSIFVLFLAIFLGVAVSFVLGSFIKIYVYRVDLISLMKPSSFSFIIAVFAGLAASYTWVKPDLDQALPGIAITVTLIPPVSALGLVLAEGSWFLFIRVLEFLLLNIMGIILGALIIFIFMRFYKSKKRAALKMETCDKSNLLIK